MAVTACLIAAAAAVAAYWAGRARPGRRLLSWAEDRSSGPHSPGWWVAQVVGLVAVAWMLTAHPRRSAANRRSWREARDARRGPAMTFRSDWTVERQASAATEEDTHG
jgi:hypothetical protein